MNQLLQWIMAMVQRLQPRQAASGDGTVQVERASGDVQIDNSRPVTMVVTQNFYSAQVETRPAANGMATPEQRALLTQIRRLPGSGESVFRWMERSFGTRMVIELRPHEARRLQSYVAGVERNLATKSEGTQCRESA